MKNQHLEYLVIAEIGLFAALASGITSSGVIGVISAICYAGALIYGGVGTWKWDAYNRHPEYTPFMVPATYWVGAGLFAGFPAFLKTQCINCGLPPDGQGWMVVLLLFGEMMLILVTLQFRGRPEEFAVGDSI